MDYAVFDEVNAVAGHTPARVYRAHIDQIIRAEELGYHSYWFARGPRPRSRRDRLEKEASKEVIS